MAQHKVRSRIAQFKQPFLVGTVTSAALLAACGGRTNETDANVEGLGGTKEDCPVQAPLPGTDCGDYVSGTSCEYEGTCLYELKCEEGEWAARTPPCNPPPPEVSSECPEDAPTSGMECNGYAGGLTCEYDADTGCPRQFECNDGEWADHSPSCNPPPPEVSSECPEDAPTSGKECNGYAGGLMCEYDADTGCPRQFECNDGEWLDYSPTCNPPPPLTGECPAIPPAPDADCKDYEPSLVCEYDDEACPWGGFVTFTCSGDSWDYNVTSCNPPPPDLEECPTVKPAVSTDCSGYVAGLECEYDTESSCPDSVRCADDAWESTTLICNPPPPEPLTECPLEVPVPGENCSAYEIGLLCEHYAACDGGIGAQCGANGIWEPVRTFCNPPPPETDEEPDAGGSSEARDGG